MDATTSAHADAGLLTAAFSALMNLPLSTNVSSSDQVEKVSVFDHHKTTYSYGQVGNPSATATTKTPNGLCLIHVKPLNKEIVKCYVKPNARIEEIKASIHELLQVAPGQQRLIFAGKQLEDGKTMLDYGMTHEPTIHLVARLSDTKPVILDPASLDTMHNYDFTHINDGDEKFFRGGERYVRPCGFKRYALNVSHKYENLLWIGSNNGVGEWPVSYHGTGNYQNKTMAEDGCILTQGLQYQFSYGIYSTPDVHLAEKYAKQFTYKNEQYIVIFQNRVNPTNLLKLPATRTETGDYWVSPNENDVRPYGICIRKV